jgi:hypothetical protein
MAAGRARAAFARRKKPSRRRFASSIAAARGLKFRPNDQSARLIVAHLDAIAHRFGRIVDPCKSSRIVRRHVGKARLVMKLVRSKSLLSQFEGNIEAASRARVPVHPRRIMHRGVTPRRMATCLCPLNLGFVLWRYRSFTHGIFHKVARGASCGGCSARQQLARGKVEGYGTVDNG